MEPGLSVSAVLPFYLPGKLRLVEKIRYGLVQRCNIGLATAAFRAARDCILMYHASEASEVLLFVPLPDVSPC